MPPAHRSGFDSRASYQIDVEGHIPARWRNRLQGMAVTECSSGGRDANDDPGGRAARSSRTGRRAHHTLRAASAGALGGAHVGRITNLERSTAMTFGPIDFVVLEFPGNKFNGRGLSSLLELVQAEIIRIIDLVVIVKDQDGKCVRARANRARSGQHPRPRSAQGRSHRLDHGQRHRRPGRQHSPTTRRRDCC